MKAFYEINTITKECHNMHGYKPKVVHVCTVTIAIIMLWNQVFLKLHIHIRLKYYSSNSAAHIVL